MIRLILGLALLISVAGAAHRPLVSPFPSTVNGVQLRNVHEVDERLYRGMEPRKVSDIRELQGLGVNRFLIFKNNVNGSVTAITKMMKNKAKVDPNQIEEVPFQWHRFPNFKVPCEQTVDALQIIRKAQNKGETLYFHCTVGEDRTGYLAGLYYYLRDRKQGARLEKIFEKKMCYHGYSAGNPNKDEAVTEKIDLELTPLFLKMAHLIEERNVDLDTLDKSLCSRDPSDRLEREAEDFRCGVSPLYPRRNRNR